jgi:hypothetical protein
VVQIIPVFQKATGVNASQLDLFLRKIPFAFLPLMT